VDPQTPATPEELAAEDQRALADLAARGQYPAPWQGDVDDMDDE
jgi:hypothetical protein